MVRWLLARFGREDPVRRAWVGWVVAVAGVCVFFAIVHLKAA